MEEQVNYSAAFAELQKIVSDLENGEIGIDELSEKVKRAAELIKICRQKLYSTSEDIGKILKELEEN